MVGIFTDYNLNRQQAVGVLKACIKQHADTPDTPNWYLKHHKGLEYLNLAMAQVTNNPVKKMRMPENYKGDSMMLVMILPRRHAPALVPVESVPRCKRGS